MGRKEGTAIYLTLTQSEFNGAVLNESELLINQNLYDVISVKHENALVKVTCVKDDKEKDLLEKIAEHLKQQSKSKKGLTFSALSTCSIDGADKIKLVKYSRQIKYRNFTAGLFSAANDFISPPPKL